LFEFNDLEWRVKVLVFARRVRGFGIRGLVFRMWGLGFRVNIMDSRFTGSGFRVVSSGSMVKG